MRRGVRDKVTKDTKKDVLFELGNHSNNRVASDNSSISKVENTIRRKIEMPLGLSSFFRNSGSYQVTTPDTLKRNFYRKSPLYSTSSYTSSRRSASICETPGPGSYYLPSPDVYKKKAPSFSMRERSFRANRNETPGPGTYSPEKVWIDKKSAPRYTFGIRHSPFVVPTHRLERVYL